MSWPRRNWPRKNEGFRIYRFQNKTYFLLAPDARNEEEAVVVAQTLNEDDEVVIDSCIIDRRWMERSSIKRIQWSELPDEWKRVFRPWLGGPPESHRGLWLLDYQPEAKAVGDLDGEDATAQDSAVS